MAMFASCRAPSILKLSCFALSTMRLGIVGLITTTRTKFTPRTSHGVGSRATSLTSTKTSHQRMHRNRDSIEEVLEPMEFLRFTAFDTMTAKEVLATRSRHAAGWLKQPQPGHSDHQNKQSITHDNPPLFSTGERAMCGSNFRLRHSAS